MTSTGYANYLASSALIDELVRSGVEDFVVCPGSRSTPLAVSIARNTGARLWMHLDERSAAFFGLGMAKAKRRPVALVCSSGTAAANFLPAVVEANLSRVPLIVLTADRPHELRDNGAPQTIDQVRIYGTHAKWFFDLAEPAADAAQINHIRSVACRVVATAVRGPAGPVHLNCPYREPLMPEAGPLLAGAEGRADGEPYTAVSHEPRMPRQAVIDRLAGDLPGKRGLILCGPQDDPALAAAVVSPAAKLGYPVLADPLSGVRFGPHARDLVLDCYDAFLRDGAFAARFAPEVVLRFGAMPTAKPVLLYLERHPGARLIVVDDDGWNEPASLASDVIQAGAVLFCQALAHALPVSGAAHSGWLADWIGADRRARAALQAALAGDQELSEGKVFAELADLLPDGTALYVGNSMPVRDLDTFFPATERRIRCLANRGANGIDGVVSSALGASTPPDGPTVLVIGDVSFYHDLNGLLAAQKHGLNLTIILLNNDGGGIFSFLPQAAEPEHFEQLFGTPHGLDFRPFAEGYGAAFRRVEGWEDFRSAVMASLAAGGVQVIEVPTNRARNVAQHRALWPLVNAAVAAGLAPEVTA